MDTASSGHPCASVQTASQLIHHSTPLAPTISQLTHFTPTISQLTAHPTPLTPTVSQLTHPTHLTPTVSQDGLPYTANMVSSSPSLAEMLSIDSLGDISKLQVETRPHQGQSSEASQVDPTTPAVVATSIDSPMPQRENQSSPDSEEAGGKKRGRVGRPRTKPQKEKADWHYHLGGVRHSRTPLTPEIREVLEVAYVSKIMAKNFRKEGQPEKERIAKITGLPVEKVQEWFKNRRKKDKMLKVRQQKQEAAIKALNIDNDQYPVTMEAVEQGLRQTEEWFKGHRRAVQGQGGLDYPLTVNPGFLEVHTTGTAESATQPPSS